jgi:FAD synthase
MDKTCVITFGRFNPPTIGHEKLFDKMAKEAKRNKADYKIFASKSFDDKKNPLKYKEKLKLLKTFFPKHKQAVADDPGRTIIEILANMTQAGEYDHIILIVGQDRVKEFDALLQKYNGKDYTFKSIKVKNAGMRDPDGEGAEGMSASKLRKAATDGNWKDFEKGLPKSVKSGEAQRLYKLLRDRLPLTEGNFLNFKQFVEAINTDIKFRQQYLDNIKNENQ